MRKILVAGGAGFIGTTLVPLLLERGYDVDVIDAFWFGDKLPENVKKIKKDLFDCKKGDFEEYEQVVFLAGISNDPMAEFNPSANFIYNGALPSYLAYIAKNDGVKRFIYASSCSVYGYSANELYDENSITNCSYPYGIAKLQGERGVLQICDEKFSVIALRQGTVCGYSPRMRFDLVVNAMIKDALKLGTITVNNPAIWRPIIDVRDTSLAFLRAIQANYELSGIFNVSGGNYTVGQLADLVKFKVEQSIDSSVSIRINDKKDFRNYKVSWQKAITMLGYNPVYSIFDTVESIFEHIGMIDFYDMNCYNIEVFKELAIDDCK